MRKHLRLAGKPSLGIEAPAQKSLTVGAKDTEHGPMVFVALGQDYEMLLTPEKAEELAVDLRSFAIEVRNGGRVA